MRFDIQARTGLLARCVPLLAVIGIFAICAPACDGHTAGGSQATRTSGGAATPIASASATAAPLDTRVTLSPMGITITPSVHVTPAPPTAALRLTPQVYRPGLLLSAYSGAPGTVVTAIGQGFEPNRTVYVQSAGLMLGTAQTDSTGSFRGTGSVPIAAQGSYSVRAWTSGLAQAETTFTVTLSPTPEPCDCHPKIALEPKSAPVGAIVTIVGTGFEPGRATNIVADTVAIAQVMTDSTGAFEHSGPVPAISLPGTYTIRVCTSASVCAQATFTVTESHVPSPPSTPAPTYSPSLTMQPASGPPGSAVAVLGSGFEPNKTVEFTCPTVSSSSSTDGQGSFSLSREVPSASPGTYTCSACTSSAVCAQADFTITAGS